MQNALDELKKCKDEIPVGCAIKLNGKVIVTSHNMREATGDVTAHAEILAIKQAQKLLGTSRLKDCDMYVTLEPCPMCAWAIIQSGIKSLYFGSYNRQYGAMGSVIDLSKIANSKIKIYGGIKEEECDRILKEFFDRIRKV